MASIKKTVAAVIMLPLLAHADDSLDYFNLSIEELLDIEVKSASGVAEQLSQTPTPVSVITEEMIKQSGAYTLRDLLSLYVPNFTQVQDQNEYNVAFRGIYTSSQQKFLVLLDGHRLNSRAYAMANPDHAIALDKIKHIEVLRGPGSSVHGNAALTNVVNIVSKSGSDLAGTRVVAAIAEHGYKEAFVEYGTNNKNFDLYAWFKYVESDGEKWTISPEYDYSPYLYDRPITSYLDRFNEEPSYDYGVKFTSPNNWSAFVNYRQSHYTEPLTTGGSSGAAYDFSVAPEIDNTGPGAQSEWWHTNITKSWQLNKKHAINLKLYYDTNRTLGVITNRGQNLNFSSIEWQDQDLGFASHWQYSLENTTLLVGLDYDYMEVTSSEAFAGSNGVVTTSLSFNGESLLPEGSESIWSSYVQVKHQVDDKWLINAGLRNDHKKRFTGPHVDEFSPRLAAIRETEDSVIKLSYAKSFVDPPYWNRYSQLGTFKGSTNLKPEILHSVQITPEYYWFDKSLQAKLNLYYNQYTDVVFRKVNAMQNEAVFTNAGEVETTGLEQEISYHVENKTLRFIGSQNHIMDVKNYPASDSEIFNIPNYQFNFIFDHQYTDNLQYQLSWQYIGERLSPINIAINGEPVADPFPNSGVRFQDPNYHLAAVSLFNFNTRWKVENSNLTLTLNVRNLFDKNWYQGGSVTHPYKQTGRWIKLGLEYKFSD